MGDPAGAAPFLSGPSLAVAIVPSTQHSGNPAANYQEGKAMMLLGAVLLNQLQAAGIAATCCWSPQEDLATLATLYEEAQHWLDGRTEARKAVISLHSDSGTWSHVFGLFGRLEDMLLASILAYGVGAAMDVDPDRVRVVDRIGDMMYSTYLFTTKTTSPSVLLECGSHESSHDLTILTSTAGRQEIAAAIVRGLVDYATP